MPSLFSSHSNILTNNSLFSSTSSDNSIQNSSRSIYNKINRDNRKSITIDLAGPFKDKSHLLSIIDHLSGHITFLPIKQISAENIIKKIKKYIHINGSVSSIYTHLKVLFISPAFHLFAITNNIMLINLSLLQHSIYSSYKKMNFLIRNSINSLQADDHSFMESMNILNITYNNATVSDICFSPNYQFYKSVYNRNYNNLHSLYSDIIKELQQILDHFNNDLLLAFAIDCNSNSINFKCHNSNKSDSITDAIFDQSFVLDAASSSLKTNDVPTHSISDDCHVQKISAFSTPKPGSEHNGSVRSLISLFDSGFCSANHSDNNISVNHLHNCSGVSSQSKSYVPIRTFSYISNHTTFHHSENDLHDMYGKPDW